MKPIVQFIHNYLHQEGLAYFVVIFCFVFICLFFFSSESGSLDLGINTKYS